MLNNCIFASNGNMVLVGMGDFMGLLPSIKTASKYLWIYPIGLCVCLLGFIEPRMLGINSALYFLFSARLQGLVGHYGVGKRFFNLVLSIQNTMLLLF